LAWKCSKCKGEIVQKERVASYTCSNCNLSLYFDGEELVPHFILPKIITEDEGEKLFKDWLYNRGFRKEIEITKKEFLFFPFWLLKVKTLRETVQDIISPAAFSELSEINHVAFRGGELVGFKEEIVRGKEIRFPAESFNKHYSALLKKEIDKSYKLLEKMLIHLPVMFIQCKYQNMDYTGLIDISTGEVIIDVFPYKPKTYTAIGFFLSIVSMSVLFALELRYITDSFVRLGIFLGTGIISYFLIKIIFVRL
jgi:hypothetical protein